MPLWWRFCFSFRSLLLLSSAFSLVTLSALEFSEGLILFWPLCLCILNILCFWKLCSFLIKHTSHLFVFKTFTSSVSSTRNPFLFYSFLLFRCSSSEPSSLDPGNTCIIALTVQCCSLRSICISSTSLKAPGGQSVFWSIHIPFQAPNLVVDFQQKSLIEVLRKYISPLLINILR